MIAYDINGRSYSLNESNLGGGEGKLYSVANHPELYAKIFKEEKRTRGREAKILEWEYMFEANELDKNFSDQNIQTFLGYLMEKQTSFKVLKDVYVENDLSYAQKVWAARNLCILTNRVHSAQRGITIGDYNADNIVIFPQTSTAKFIDVDSFQLTIHRSNKRILCPCTVGVPEFMAPEIARRLKKEKTDLENVDQDADNPIFNKYTDFYSMAYHIFALLMNGSSPFASMANMEAISQHPSKNVSSIDIDQFHAAEKGEFVFVRHFLFKKAPEYAPKYKMLSQELRKLFERAFIGGAKDPTVRPDAMEFYNALTEYFQSLKKCECGHYMPSNYKGECEWCRINRAEG